MIVKVKSKEELIKLGCALLSREFYCGKEIEVEKDCITDDYYGKGLYWHKNWLIFPKKKVVKKQDYKKKWNELKGWLKNARYSTSTYHPQNSRIRDLLSDIEDKISELEKQGVKDESKS